MKPYVALNRSTPIDVIIEELGSIGIVTDYVNGRFSVSYGLSGPYIMEEEANEDRYRRLAYTLFKVAQTARIQATPTTHPEDL